MMRDERSEVGGKGSRRGELLASLFIVAFLLPNVAALVVPYEEFPYSSAPMFAHYVTEEMPRYRFRFMAEPEGSEAAGELTGRDIGLNDTQFGRYFFGSVYGSIDPLSPYGHLPPDDRAAFEERLSRFFADYVRVLERRAPERAAALEGIRLELVRIDVLRRGLPLEVRVIGQYDPAAARFTHGWRGEP